MLVYNEANHSFFLVGGCTICSWMGELIFISFRDAILSGWTLEFLVDDLGILEVRIRCMWFTSTTWPQMCIDVFNPIIPIGWSNSFFSFPTWLKFPHFSRVKSAMEDMEDELPVDFARLSRANASVLVGCRDVAKCRGDFGENAMQLDLADGSREVLGGFLGENGVFRPWTHPVVVTNIHTDGGDLIFILTGKFRENWVKQKIFIPFHDYFPMKTDIFPGDLPMTGGHPKAVATAESGHRICSKPPPWRRNWRRFQRCTSWWPGKMGDILGGWRSLNNFWAPKQDYLVWDDVRC